MKERIEFQVWADCITLGRFTTLKEATENAERLLKQFIEDEVLYEEDLNDNNKRIYENQIMESDIFNPIVAITKQYDFNGNLVHDFDEDEYMTVGD